jgi:hypothetical protein
MPAARADAAGNQHHQEKDQKPDTVKSIGQFFTYYRQRFLAFFKNFI